MNMIFGNLNNEGLEEAEDRLGGGSLTVDTDGYDATIKVAYAGKSAGGAQNVTFIFDLGGREYRETIYVTNKKGENFFLNKDDKTKKVPLPGFTTVNDICLVATGDPLWEQVTEDKMVKVYDFDENKELPKSVPVLTNLLGKPVTLAIVKQIVDKSKKDDSGNYVPTGETREENFIDKVFATETKLTVVEATKGVEATFYAAWVEKNKGQIRDKSSKDAGSGQSGRPGRSAGGPPQANGGTAAGKPKSLFGNKSA